MRYADLVIDNKNDRTDELYTYGCEDDSVEVGSKVYVRFAGRKDPVAGYVFRLKDEPGKEFKRLRYIEEKDGEVSLTEEMVRTASWMRTRYLCRYIDAVELFTPAGQARKDGRLRELFAGTSEDEEPGQEKPELTGEQRQALDEIEAEEGHGIFLIHGVTGSGKTEIYMRLIEDAVSKGKGAVMLVPEISLTKQITDRFLRRFGAANIAVLHSRLSPGERHDEWMKIRSGRARIVIGARSAVFCPMENIGVIIMDEEHESTYKSDMTPKYETVEVALKRAMDHGAKLILGSATPSAVSYARSEEGLYKRVTLTERYNKVGMPEVKIVDMRQELRMGSRDIVSGPLKEAIDAELAKKKQVILFLNRRGYSTFVSCLDCGTARTCPDCGISMTYHKRENVLMCHYCGRRESVPAVCPECGSKRLGYFGTGTEKTDERIKALFPDAKCARLDLDTMRRKGSIEKILGDFEKGKTDILIGTQVVAKGLDFRNVGLVGILSADISLNIPDYRSAERTFQLICQAAGRAGRGDEKGKVIIQTFTPDNYAVRAAAAQDYDSFFRQEISFRMQRSYPPFSDFIQVVFQSKDEGLPRKTAESWETALRSAGWAAPGAVMMSGPMIVMNKKDGYKECLLIKCPAGQRKTYMRGLGEMKRELVQQTGKVRVTVDVNPYSMWRG